MSRYVAFLRGINVGGHRVTGRALCASVAALGFDDVASFRSSGNVVFATADDRHRDGHVVVGQGDDRADQIARAIEAGLATSFGYAVPTFVRTDAATVAIAAYRPFDAPLVEASDGKLQVALLAAEPGASVRAKVLALATDEDRLAIRGSELYWLPSGGVMDAALDLQAISALVGTTTMRTKNTIEMIAAKYFAH